MNDCKNYHHGDLRNALIIAAAELIEESGSTDFAMSDAAKRAGVSNAAPYRHFKDKDALLEAVRELGLIGLSQVTEKIRAQHPSGSRECIVAIGAGYISYLAKHGAFYSLMWGDKRFVNNTPKEGASSGFYALVDEVGAWCKTQGISGRDPIDLSVKLWAMAHGLAALEVNGQIEQFISDVDVYNLLANSTNTFLDGLLSVAAS